VGILASVLTWGLLVSERRAQLVGQTEEISAEISKAMALGLERQIDGLTDLARLWSRFGPGSRAEWQARAEQRIDRNPALAFVAIVGSDGVSDRVATGSGDGSERHLARTEREAIRTRLRAGWRPETPVFEGPTPSAEGRPGYRVLVPLPPTEGGTAILVASYDAGRFLEEILQARASGFAVTVRWKHTLIHARGLPSEDAFQDWWDVTTPVALPTEGDWTLRLRPTAELSAARLTPLPHYLLIAGVLLSLALAVLVHQLRVTQRQSRTLAASNRALEHRGMELESRVAERTAELQDAIDELEAFNYSVSHDLRSPLGAILNFTTILAEDYDGKPLDEEGRGILERIRRSALRATALLEDLLRLSRAGRAAIARDRIDMTALAREAYGQALAAEGADDVELVVEPLPEAHGDRTLLGDVFTNLFGNALKYSRGCEKRRIEVSGRIEGREVVYVVSDNGEGFDMRFVDKLFRLFERLHGDEEIEGTGVGLAMVRRIVKRHGGRVWAEGEPGVGARFSFSLPKEDDA
jgi:two-component system sensor kinase